MGQPIGVSMERRPVPVVGTAVPRRDAVEKVTGQARYAADLFSGSDVLHAAVKYSEIPHGEILAIDTSAAEQLPGVVAVLTAKDFFDTDSFTRYGGDQPVLATDHVLYVGQPIAAVAAVDPLTAREAAQQIIVRYRDLPHVATIDEAIGPSSPRLHPDVAPLVEDRHAQEAARYNNVCSFYRRERGDVDFALARADLVFEHTFRFPRVFHYPMEPHTIIAQARSREITVWTATQGANLVRETVARTFRTHLNQVRVIVPFVGGGFGSKNQRLELLVVGLARKTGGRPVMLVCSVEESMYLVRRHAARCTLRTGVTRDGIILARKAEVLLDTGGYGTYGPRAAFLASYRILGPYHVEHVQIDVFSIYTNSGPATAFRAPSSPQTTWGAESQLDIIADTLGIPPLEFRERNLAEYDERITDGLPPLRSRVADLIEAARPFMRGPSLLLEPTTPRRGVWGIGMALTAKTGGAGQNAMCILRLHSTGDVSVLVSSTEIGQGAHTALAQIAAEEAGLPYARVRIVPVDTSAAPFDVVTASSRTTVHVGNAVQRAAQDLARQMREIAARMWGCAAADVSLCDGHAVGPHASEPFGRLAAWQCGGSGGELVGVGSTAHEMAERTGWMTGIGSFWEINMGVATVSVDIETGQVFVDAYTSITDAGRVIHPQLLEGQDEGGIVQGIGHTFLEEMQYEAGQLVNGTLVDYCVPTFRHLPREFVTRFIENGDGPGPFGAKGVSEGGIMSVSGAVANALARAISVRIYDLPLTPERVWRALRAGLRAEREDAPPVDR